MCKAFSLVEVAISLLIGLVVLTGISKLAMTRAHAIAHESRWIHARTSLDMAKEELRLATRGLEHGFFEHFPLKADFTPHHPSSVNHGAIQFSERCEENPETACALWWDLTTVDEEPLLYRLSDGNARNRFGLVTVDESRPAALPAQIGPMSVLLMIGKETAFPRLVVAIESGQVVLADEADQPWPWIGLLIPSTTRVVHLGQLEVTHTTLVDRDGLGKKISHRPWRLGEEGWRGGRSRTSYGQLERMILDRTVDDPFLRLVLIAKPRDPWPLTRTLEIAGYQFDEEVISATLLF